MRSNQAGWEPGTPSLPDSGVSLELAWKSLPIALWPPNSFRVSPQLEWQRRLEADTVWVKAAQEGWACGPACSQMPTPRVSAWVGSQLHFPPSFPRLWILGGAGRHGEQGVGMSASILPKVTQEAWEQVLHL